MEKKEQKEKIKKLIEEMKKNGDHLLTKEKIKIIKTTTKIEVLKRELKHIQEEIKKNGKSLSFTTKKDLNIVIEALEELIEEKKEIKNK